MKTMVRNAIAFLLIGLLLLPALASCARPTEVPPTTLPPTPTTPPTAIPPTPTTPTTPPTAIPPTPTTPLPVAMFRGDPTHSGVYQDPGSPGEWIFEAGGEILSSPLIHAGVAYFGAVDGYLYAVEAATGQLKWKFEADKPTLSSPTIAGDLVYFGSGLDVADTNGGHLFAVDVATGQEKWRFKTGGTVISSPAVAGGIVYAGSADGYLYALDAQNGQERWKYKAQGPFVASPAIVGDALYITAGDSALYALDPLTGKVRWFFMANAPIVSSPAVADGVAYFGTIGANFYAVDVASHKALWQFQAQDQIQSSPAVAEGVVYFGSFDKRVYALDAQTGQEKWQFDAKSEIMSSPAVLDGVLYFGCFSGRVYALDAATGAELWRFQAGSQVQSSPSVAGNSLYVASFDKRLYAINRAGPQIALAPTATPRPILPTPTPLSVSLQPVSRGTGDLPWWNDRVFYEVFVRSFQDSDGDGIGDLRGLIDKLDYLNDGDPATTTDLGVTGLWLMPVSESPSYHGYDVVDYYAVEQDYGTNDDFKQLVAEAHKRGIVVIVDLVMNHTSDQHPWFQDAQVPGSAHESWYIWTDDPPDYLSPWGSPVWHPLGNRYYYGLFWSGMPDLNYENGAVTEAMRDIIRFWLADMGADGFRLDAVRHLIEDGAVQANTPDTHTWLKDFYRYVHSITPDALLVGEAWDIAAEEVKYVGDQVDLVFEFNLAQAMLNALWRGDNQALVETQQSDLDLFPAGQYAAFLTNHDQNRVMNQLRDNLDRAKAAAALLLTNPGMPFIYYGEEIGMRGAKPDERIRAPMQWDGTAAAGFTTGQPWEDLSTRFEETNVAAQTGDPTSLLSHYRALIRLRAAHPALRAGDMTLVDTGSRQVYSYLRHGQGETLLVVVNLSDKEVSDYKLTLAAGPLPGAPEAVLLLGEGQIAAPEVNAGGGFDGYAPLPTLPPYGAFVIQLK
jgi:alpha-amylase